jgi:hypothetical protein
VINAAYDTLGGYRLGERDFFPKGRECWSPQWKKLKSSGLLTMKSPPVNRAVGADLSQRLPRDAYSRFPRDIERRSRTQTGAAICITSRFCASSAGRLLTSRALL